MDTFVVQIPVNDPKAMDKFNEAMAEVNDANVKYIREEAVRLGVPEGAMCDIWYLRTRSRWTQEKEDRLIELAKAGLPIPNIMAGEM